MARYIDADKIPFYLHKGWDLFIADKQDIDKIPTADAVEVVMCKDCKHQEQCCEFIMISAKDKTLKFCSCGDRRDT